MGYTGMSTGAAGNEVGIGKLRWIAAGFVGAFAASVLTVIYTGLMVEGSRSDFDAGFRSVTLSVGETQTVELVFESPLAHPAATLELVLPEFAGPAEQPELRELTRSAALDYGRNVYSVELVGVSPGSGYLVARVIADEPVGTYRVFVTVTAPAP
jgi:hypothetical protein